MECGVNFYQLQRRIEALIRRKFTSLMIGKFLTSQGEEHEALDERTGRQREMLHVIFQSVHTQDLLSWGVALSLTSVGEVVLFEVREKSRVYRPPSQEFLGQYTRPRTVDRRHGAEKRAEVGVCLCAGNADHRQVQVATDDAGNVAEWHTLVANPVKP